MTSLHLKCLLMNLVNLLMGPVIFTSVHASSESKFTVPDSKSLDILMRGAKPEHPDAYLCTAYTMTEPLSYIYRFEALANLSMAHHILLYGCNGEASTDDPIWQCPAICRGEQPTILFAWAKNAPPTVLPKGVGLRIGQLTNVKTIVLQVHYSRAFEGEAGDMSGIRIFTTKEKQPYVAGIFLMMATVFSIPPRESSYPVDIGCDFHMEKSIFPFAYRTHAHSLGIVITGYKYNGSYHEIGKGNPQWPQAFYPVQDQIEVKPGDSLVARCTYNSTAMEYPVSVGSRSQDEMCNFYIMFYMDSSVKNPAGRCLDNRKPELTGDHLPADASIRLPPNPLLDEEAHVGQHPAGVIENSIQETHGNSALSPDHSVTDVLMRGAKPETTDAYICTAYPVDDAEIYIYKYEALANASTAHHMLLYGCDGEPWSNEVMWDCPGMCKGGAATIMFAWAKNAPPTVLPEGVGFRIGSKTSIKTLVLQVHYARSFRADENPDNSGIRLHVTPEKQPYIAGIFLLAGSFFTIPPRKSSYPVDVSCMYPERSSMFPFAYRTHAHGLGKVITGYLYNGSYHEIGKGNPQWPQAFYPVQSKIEVKPGNYLAARCTYDSETVDHSVEVGSTGNDEMCNFYIMFYTDSSAKNPSGTCGGNMYPNLTGKNFPKDVSEPLPPNPALENEARGHHHHHHSSGIEINEKVASNHTWTRDILMKGAKPEKPDAYLCTAYSVTHEEAYITKFEALANASTAHHMLMYGCDGEPYSTDAIWDCPPMCRGRAQSIMFAWAKNAPATVLPKDVGFRIGRKSSIKTIVLQIHYARKFGEQEKPDKSGIRLHLTFEKQQYVAGIFLLQDSFFSIPPGNPSYPVDVSCQFKMEESIFPFAYRTHAHGLGKVITGYMYNDTYHQIGKGNPQWPQAFYPVQEKIEVKPGDYLAARCTYDTSSLNVRVNVGSTGHDEMCNFYIMFYTSSSVEDPSGGCGGNRYTWLTGMNFPKDVSEPLPPNPALEEKAKGHPISDGHAEDEHKKGGKSESDKRFEDAMKGNQVSSKNSHDVNFDVRLALHFQDQVSPSYARYKNKEILQYDYDFDDINARSRHYVKRQHHEYYDDYAANDERSRGTYGLTSTEEGGLSRNRNKQFEAMNHQQQHFPVKNPSSKQHHQSDLPLQKQKLHQPVEHPPLGSGSLGGNNVNQERTQPMSVGSRPPELRTNSNIDIARQDSPTQAHSYIHFGHPLDFNSSWPRKDLTLGQVGGVATDNHGNVYIFHRGSRTWTADSFSMNNDFNYADSPIPEDVIVILDREGQVLRTFGAGQYFMPHGIEVDKDGNIWLTDVALHQVFKIPPDDTKPSLVLGHRFQHGTDLSYFCKPTDVAVLSSGEFYVSDGYCNGRVLKFSKDGKVIKAWGQKSMGERNPLAGIFSIPHGLTISEENKLVCVADRENGRIQCFDLEGNFQHVIKHPQFGTRLFAVEQSPFHGGVLYAVNGPAFDGPLNFAVKGFTLDIKTGDILEIWDTPQHLENPHDVCADPESHAVYVGELSPSAVWKFSRAIPGPTNSSMKAVDASKVDTDTKSQGNSLHTTSVATDGKHDAIVDAPEVNDTALALDKDSESRATDITPSVIIGCLLVIPVVLLLVITLLIRAHQSGRLKCYGHGKRRVFSLQGILGNSHKGFDPLSTEESDHELDLEDSDREEHVTPQKAKSKA